MNEQGEHICKDYEDYERMDDDVKQESVFDQEDGSNDGMGNH
jgi:hypothetical protein